VQIFKDIPKIVIGHFAVNLIADDSRQIYVD